MASDPPFISHKLRPFGRVTTLISLHDQVFDMSSGSLPCENPGQMPGDFPSPWLSTTYKSWDDPLSDMALREECLHETAAHLVAEVSLPDFNHWWKMKIYRPRGDGGFKDFL